MLALLQKRSYHRQYQMKKQQKKSLIKNVIEFVKLQLAGNILFWGTLLGSALLFEVMHMNRTVALVIASVVSHILFFIVDRNWVFSDKTGKRKDSGEIVRFAVFMSMNFFINIGIIEAAQRYMGVNLYAAQFLAAFFFTFWTWLGLKFWVFRHARHAHHQALTIERKDEKERRRAGYQRLKTKQKTKRTA